MKKEEAIRIITSCAKLYHDQLENRNLLFIFGNTSQADGFEAAFLPQNFLHMTGVEVQQATFTGSSDFYEKCLKGQLRFLDFQFATNGTTEMKLMVLPQLMQIQKSAKMVGNFNFSKSLLITEKLAGNVTACMGFVRDDNFYIPNTALKEDIRNVTRHPQQRILAVYKKAISERLYNRLCYVGKGVDYDSILIPKNISAKIDTDNLEIDFEKKMSKSLQQEKISIGTFVDSLSESNLEKEHTPFNDLLVELLSTESSPKRPKSHEPER